MNVLNKQNRFIFIHIPKTAGESIRKALSQKSRMVKIYSKSLNYSSSISSLKSFTSYNLIKNRFTQAVERPRQTGEKIFYKFANWLNPSSPQWLYLEKHSTAQEITKVLGEEKWNDCFTFAFIRNPYDQVVSFYHHLRKPLYISKKTLGRQYPEFLDSGFLEPREACKAAMQYEFNEWVMKAYGYEEFNHYGWFDSQLKWLTNEEGQIIVDFVGKYEKLMNSWKAICNSIGISVDLPKLNSSNRVSYRSYYSESSRRIIESKFEKDMIIYKYDF